MKTIVTICLLSLVLHATVKVAHAQGTAFTYNGRLTDAGLPANGNYDMNFALFDAENGGAQVGATVSMSPVVAANGLFAVTLDFGPGIFTGAARWMEVSVRRTGSPNFITLTPRQGLKSSPYAIFAGSVANGSVGALAIQDASISAVKIASGELVKSINGLKDVVTVEGRGSVSVTAEGNNLVFNGVGGGGGVWNTIGTDIYYNLGKVGIGTATPTSLLDLQGAQDALHISGFEPVMTFFDLNHNSARNAIQSVNGGLNIFTDKYLNGTDVTGFIRLDGNGNVGIGSSQPVGKLEVVGQDALRIIGYEPFLTLYDSNAGYAGGRIQSVAGGLGQFTDAYLRGVDSFGFMLLAPNGNVGIGSSQPVGKLEVVGQDALRMIGYQPFLTFYDSSAGYAAGRIQSVGGGLGQFTDAYLKGADPFGYVLLHPNGNVGIGTANPQAKLDVNGIMRTKVLTITGGADLAEPFKISEETIAKGSVVVIDEDHPGQLKLSSHAYDTRVAGIVSGANGVHPGISISQEGVNDGGQDVALTGRVYVLADASHDEIKPGDLLTSSDVPGHAMKVADHARAQGAILGKAMSGLKEGRGNVLVLVTLQ